MDYWSKPKTLRLSSQQTRQERYVALHTWKSLEGIVPHPLPAAIVVVEASLNPVTHRVSHDNLTSFQFSSNDVELIQNL